MLASIQQRLKIACAIGIPSLACLLVPKIFNQTISSMSTEARGLYSMAYVTIDKEESAKILAKQIVSSKLAACVNIVPKITSVYEWEGKLNEDGESLMIIKTKTSHVDDLVAFVKANHPYEVCEVITTLIDKGNPDYLSWISETVPEKK